MIVLKSVGIFLVAAWYNAKSRFEKFAILSGSLEILVLAFFSQRLPLEGWSELTIPFCISSSPSFTIAISTFAAITGEKNKKEGACSKSDSEVLLSLTTVNSELHQCIRESVDQNLRESLSDLIKGSLLTETIHGSLTTFKPELHQCIKESVDQNLRESLSDLIKGSLLTETVRGSLITFKPELHGSIRESVDKSLRESLSDLIKGSLLTETVHGSLITFKPELHGSIRESVDQSLRESLSDLIKGSLLTETVRGSLATFNQELHGSIRDSIDQSLHESLSDLKGIALNRDGLWIAGYSHARAPSVYRGVH